MSRPSTQAYAKYFSKKIFLYVTKIFFNSNNSLKVFSSFFVIRCPNKRIFTVSFLYVDFV